MLARTSNFCLDAHQAGVNLGTDILSETPREVSAQGVTPFVCSRDMPSPPGRSVPRGVISHCLGLDSPNTDQGQVWVHLFGR